MRVLEFLFFAIFICQFVSELSGQDSYFEVGAGIGISNYSGDMSVDEVAAAFATAKASAVIYSRYNLNSFLSVKGGLSYIQYAADDAKATSAAIVSRNLSFHSNLIEVSLTGEINLWRYEPVYGNSRFALYGMAGVGGFYFNPTAEFEGERYRLQPAGTEGQGLEEYPERDFYSLYQIAFPVGGGAKIKINESLNLNVEIGLRFTLTDYLDDLSTTYPNYDAILAARGEIVADLSHRRLDTEPGSLNDSQRGNPDVKDYYYSFHVGLSYNLLSSFSGGVRPRRKKSITSKCPTF